MTRRKRGTNGIGSNGNNFNYLWMTYKHFSEWKFSIRLCSGLTVQISLSRLTIWSFAFSLFALEISLTSSCHSYLDYTLYMGSNTPASKLSSALRACLLNCYLSLRNDIELPLIAATLLFVFLESNMISLLYVSGRHLTLFKLDLAKSILPTPIKER